MTLAEVLTSHDRRRLDAERTHPTVPLAVYRSRFLGQVGDLIRPPFS